MANPLKMLKLKPRGFQFIQELPISAPPKKVWQSLINSSKWFNFSEEQKEKTILELTPGGRWYARARDGSEHLFAYVTRIEPEKLLRFNGPLGMTHLPVTNALIFELQPQAGGKKTLLRMAQRTFGFIDPDLQKRYGGGWKHLLGQLKIVAEK